MNKKVRPPAINVKKTHQSGNCHQSGKLIGLNP